MHNVLAIQLLEIYQTCTEMTSKGATWTIKARLNCGLHCREVAELFIPPLTLLNQREVLEAVNIIITAANI